MSLILSNFAYKLKETTTQNLLVMIMKDFIYNTTLGKCFFAEFGNFIQSNCINGSSDFYDDVFMVIIEEFLSLSAEELKKLTLIAYRYELKMEIRAESNSLIIEFERLL